MGSTLMIVQVNQTLSCEDLTEEDIVINKPAKIQFAIARLGLRLWNILDKDIIPLRGVGMEARADVNVTADPTV